MFICGNINKTVQPLQINRSKWKTTQSKNKADTGKQSPVAYTVDQKPSTVAVPIADVDKKHSNGAELITDVDKKPSNVAEPIADVENEPSNVAVPTIDADSSTAVGTEKYTESSEAADHPSDVGDRREQSASKAGPHSAFDTARNKGKYRLLPHDFNMTPTDDDSTKKESHNVDNIPRPASHQAWAEDFNRTPTDDESTKKESHNVDSVPRPATHQAWAEETVTEEEQKPDPQQTGSESDKRNRIYEDKSAKKTRNSLTFEGQEGQYFVDPKKDKSVQTVNEDRRQGDNAVHMSFTRAHTSMDSYNETRITKLREQVALYRDDISNLRQQNSDLQTRLSKIMSERLTDNNPDIADLSDKNRPTNLAERFSELYSNEWSDAYEDLEQWAGSEREEEIIAVLLEIVTAIFNKCRDKSQDDMNKLTKMMMRVCGLSEWSENLSSSMKEIKDLRKRTYTGVVASLTEVIHGDVLKIVASHLHNGRPEYLATESVRKYTETAVEICWLMAVQDPPIYMQTSLQGTSFNKEMYKEYTRSGNHYDYLVWPALFLYEGGSMLGKGIAQAKEVVAQPRSSSAKRTKNKQKQS